MQGSKGNKEGVAESMGKVVLGSKNTPRYDDVFFGPYRDCVSPKQLFSVFSSVAEDVHELIPISPTNSQLHAPAVMVNTAYGPVSLSVGNDLVGRTSITSRVHGAHTQEHAQLGRQVGATPPGRQTAVSPRGPVVTERPSAAASHGLAPMGGSPVLSPVQAGGNQAATRPAVHGNDRTMHMPGASPVNFTSIKNFKVTKSPFVRLSQSMSDSHFKQTKHDIQGGPGTASTPVDFMKEVPRNLQYTKEQLVAFGGIQEEARRDVRSSGRLRTQPNADMTQMERAMLIAKKRAETPVIGMSASKITSITSFSENQIIDNAKSLGVSLGVSHTECIKSVRLIKDTEIQRSLTMLKCNDQLEKNGEKASLCLAVSRASDLCDDLEVEENLVTDEDDLIPKAGTRKIKQRKKKSYDKKNIRRSNRIRIKSSKLQ
jgi:hypothetical protein